MSLHLSKRLATLEQASKVPQTIFVRWMTDELNTLQAGARGFSGSLLNLKKHSSKGVGRCQKAGLCLVSESHDPQHISPSHPSICQAHNLDHAVLATKVQVNAVV